MNLSILIRIILGLAFLQGILSYIGIPVIFYRSLLEVSIILLFFSFLYILSLREDKSFSCPGLIWFGFFTIVVFASGIINDSDLFASIRMYVRVLWPYLFFISILNISLSAVSINKINRFIVLLVILQIPAAIYKFIKYGVVEGEMIGTISTQSGALSTIFPLIIIGYLVAFYFYYKKNIMYLLLIFGFIFFAWGGGKRAFFIFLPIMLFSAFLIYKQTIKRINLRLVFSSLFLLFFITGITIYLGARLNPVFNPEKSQWGSFNLTYMINQAVTTQTQEAPNTPGQGTRGRVSSFKAAFINIYDKNDLSRILVGDGPDRLDKSDDQRARYGITYGISGVTFYLISSGIIGTLSFFSLFFFFGIKSYYYLKKLREPFYLAIAFGTVMAVIVFLLDYFLYSTAFFSSYIPSLLFFYIIAILFKQDTRKVEIYKY